MPKPTLNQHLTVDDVTDWLEGQREEALQVGVDAATFLEILIDIWKGETSS